MFNNVIIINYKIIYLVINIWKENQINMERGKEMKRLLTDS